MILIVHGEMISKSMVEDDVLVVTHPLAPASESHVEALLSIISAITSATLVTMNLSSESVIREEHEVIEVSHKAPGASILVAAFRFVLNQFQMCRVIYRRDEEIILFFGATSYLLPIVAAKLFGRTVVLEPRGNVPLTLRLQWEQRVPTPIARLLAGSIWMLERIGYQTADAIITYTASMAEELALDKYDNKLYPDGARHIDTKKFYPKIPFDEREDVVGFLGRLDEEKGIRILARVVKGLPDNITFRFIGDGDLRPWLEQELKAEINAGKVEITGWINHNEVPDQLNDLRLLVLFSEPTEGLPTVILESMACATPVFSTPVSGVPDVVRERETGFLVQDRRPEHISDKIKEALQNENLNTISGNCRKTINNKFSFKESTDRYEKMLIDIEDG